MRSIGWFVVVSVGLLGCAARAGGRPKDAGECDCSVDCPQEPPDIGSPSQGEGPWSVKRRLNGVSYDNGGAYAFDPDGNEKDAEWVEVFDKVSGWAPLSASVSWDITVSANSTMVTCNGTTPRNCLKFGVAKTSGAVAANDRHTVNLEKYAIAARANYHAVGRYQVAAMTWNTAGTAVDKSEFATFWVVNAGTDLRTTLFCLPSASFPWPERDDDMGGDKDARVDWSIDYLDNAAFTGCAAGEALASYAIDLAP